MINIFEFMISGIAVVFIICVICFITDLTADKKRWKAKINREKYERVRAELMKRDNLFGQSVEVVPENKKQNEVFKCDNLLKEIYALLEENAYKDNDPWNR